ncbi:MAG: hypothetical protein JXB49_16455 [Bacteroidales bacterium]|nr:hypothetical protein [Bacteroidales bacterium]
MISTDDAILFTLFHHDINSKNDYLNFDSHKLLQLTQGETSNDIKEISRSISSVITKNINGLKDSEISVTLTGGLDSRLILAALLKLGIKPNCLTYGNSRSADINFSVLITKDLHLNHHVVSQDYPNKEWYYEWVVETIKRDKGNSYLHRAHRTHAIAEHTKYYSPKVLFTGHMGGEGLRGLSYNNYFSSSFVELVNERNKTPKLAALQILDKYFIKVKNNSFDSLISDVMKLPWMKNNNENNRHYFLTELVAKLHHSQDLRIFNSYIPNVIPVFLQEEYLVTLFRSSYNSINRNKKYFKSYNYPSVYCKILEQLYPGLLKYQLTNRYSPADYLKGLWYYLPLRVYRKVKSRKVYLPSFSYGKWFEDFIQEHSREIVPELWDIYDKEKYFNTLNQNSHKSDEGYWHKFSNPIFFDLVNKYKAGKIQ